jgi:hypothetical protein
VNGREEVDFPSIVAGGDASEMLELIEEPFNPVSELIGLRIVRDMDFAVPFGRNNHFGICFFDHLAQRIGVVSFIGDHAAGGLAVQQVGRSGYIVRLAAGQDEAQRAPLGIGKGMNFGR